MAQQPNESNPDILVKPKPLKITKRPNIIKVLEQRQKTGLCGSVPKRFAVEAEDQLVNKIHSEMSCEMPGVPRSTFLMVFSPDGSKVASTHGNHNVYITDLRTGKNINTLIGHPRTPWCIAFHPSSNQILATGCLGGQVRIWDLTGGSEVWTADCQTVIASLAFHPTERLLVIATFNEIYFWDWSQPKPFMHTCTGTIKEKVRYVAFDRDGRKLITGVANLPKPPTSRWERVRQCAQQPVGPTPPVRDMMPPVYRTYNRYVMGVRPREEDPDEANPSSFRVNLSRVRPLLSDQERRITVCYRNLVQQYESLVQRYLDVYRSRANTIDRGTDPMEQPGRSSSSVQTSPPRNVRNTEPEQPVPSTSRSTIQNTVTSPQPGPSGVKRIHIVSGPANMKRLKRVRSKKGVLRPIRSSDSSSSSDSSDETQYSFSNNRYKRTCQEPKSTGATNNNSDVVSDDSGNSSEHTLDVDNSDVERSNRSDRNVNGLCDNTMKKFGNFTVSAKSAFRVTFKNGPSTSGVNNPTVNTINASTSTTSLNEASGSSSNSTNNNSNIPFISLANSPEDSVIRLDSSPEPTEESNNIVPEVFEDSVPDQRPTGAAAPVVDRENPPRLSDDNGNNPPRRRTPRAQQRPDIQFPNDIGPRVALVDELRSVGEYIREVHAANRMTDERRPPPPNIAFPILNNDSIRIFPPRMRSVSRHPVNSASSDTTSSRLSSSVNEVPEESPAAVTAPTRATVFSDETQETETDSETSVDPTVDHNYPIYTMGRPLSSESPNTNPGSARLFAYNRLERNLYARRMITRAQAEVRQLHVIWSMCEDLRQLITRLRTNSQTPRSESVSGSSTTDDGTTTSQESTSDSQFDSVAGNVGSHRTTSEDSDQRHETGESTTSSSFQTASSTAVGNYLNNMRKSRILRMCMRYRRSMSLASRPPRSASHLNRRSRTQQPVVPPRTTRAGAAGNRIRIIPGSQHIFIPGSVDNFEDLQIINPDLDTLNPDRDPPSNPDLDSTSRPATDRQSPDVLMQMIDRLENLIWLDTNRLNQTSNTLYNYTESPAFTHSEILIQGRLIACRDRLDRLGRRHHNLPLLDMDITGISRGPGFIRFRARHALSVMIEMLTVRYEDSVNSADRIPVEPLLLLAELGLALTESLLVRVFENLPVSEDRDAQGVSGLRLRLLNERMSRELAFFRAHLEYRVSHLDRMRDMFYSIENLSRMSVTEQDAEGAPNREAQGTAPRICRRNAHLSLAENAEAQRSLHDRFQRLRAFAGRLEQNLSRRSTLTRNNTNGADDGPYARAATRVSATVSSPSAGPSLAQNLPMQRFLEHPGGRLRQQRRRITFRYGALNGSQTNEDNSGSDAALNVNQVPIVQINDVPVADPTQVHRPARLPTLPQQRIGAGGMFRPRFLHPLYSGINPFDADMDESQREQVFGVDTEFSSAISTNHRIQVWDMEDRRSVLDISNSTDNLVISECKIHNDASVDISQDGNMLVTLLPGGYLNITNKLGVYSIKWGSIGQCLYTINFDQNAVSVSLCATARYLAVGLASRRVSLIPGSERCVMAQLFRLDEDGQSVLVRDIEKARDLSYTSLNCIRWSPIPGQGLVYATNTGQLKVLT